MDDKLRQELEKRFGTVYTPVTNTAPVTKASSGVSKSGMATSKTPESVRPNINGITAEQKKILRESAMPVMSFKSATEKGKGNSFMLGSVADPYLGQFEGMTFTDDEWNNVQIGAGKGTQERLLSPEPVDVERTNAFRAENDTGADWTFSELYSQKEAKEREINKRNAIAQSGVTYMDRVRSMAPTDAYAINDINWLNPLDVMGELGQAMKDPGAYAMGTLGNIGSGLESFGQQADRARDEFNKSFLQTSLTALGALGATAESVGGDNPYLQFLVSGGAQLNQWASSQLIKNPQLNRSADNQREFLEGGWTDPAWYATAVGSTLPHIGASMAAAIVGTAATGGNPLGGATAAGSYGYAVEQGSMYDELLNKGYSLKAATDGSRVYGAIAGALDSVVPGKIGGKIMNTFSKRLVSTGIKQEVKRKIVTETAKSMLTEGVTESMQEFANNVTMRFFDKNQDIFENLPETFFQSIAGGGVYGPAHRYIEGSKGVDNINVKQNVGGKESAAREEQEGGTAGESPMPSTEGTRESTSLGSFETVDDALSSPQLDTEGKITALASYTSSLEKSIQMGEKIQEKYNDSEIADILSEAREDLVVRGNQAKQLLTEYLEETKKPVIYNDNLKVELSKSAEDTYIAKGSVTIGDTSYSIPFSLENEATLPGVATMNVLNKIQGYLNKTLQNEGIQDDVALDNIVNAIDAYSSTNANMEAFVTDNYTDVLRAQDASSLVDFLAIDKTRVKNPEQFFNRANTVDAKMITAKQAASIIENLAGDLGVNTQFVSKLTTPEGKRALGSFVEEAGDKIIKIVTANDGSADVRKSTPYHEVGHAYFRNLLTDRQKAELLNAVRENEGKDMNDAMAEEVLVETLKGMVDKRDTRMSKYGRVIATFMDMVDRVIEFFGRDPKAKMNAFYRDILGTKRPSESKKQQIAYEKAERSAVQEEYYQDPNALTSKFLSHKEVAGKQFIGVQQARNAVRGAGLKQAEIDIIMGVLDNYFDGRKKIAVSELENAIVGELLPLDVVESRKYADFGLDNIAMEGWKSSTHIYDSPVEHGISGHFTGETDKLFGHTRIATDGGTRALLEVQSDFFQKTRNKDYASINDSKRELGETYRKLSSAIDGYIKDGLGEKDADTVDEVLRSASNQSLLLSAFRSKSVSTQEFFQTTKALYSRLSEQLDVEVENNILVESTLSPYANIWHERMIKEEIRLAALDGVRKFRIPTPRTLAYIEKYAGMSDGVDAIPYTIEGGFNTTGEVPNLDVGQVVEMVGANEEWVVVSATDSSMLVVPQYAMNDSQTEYANTPVDVDGETMYYNGRDGETFQQPSGYVDQGEFNPSNLVDEQLAVYNFYKRKVNPYFEKLRKGNVQEITDENGFTWLETKVTAMDKQAVEAFQTEEVDSSSTPYVGVHNTSIDKLKASIELGGFPMPSIAVVPASSSFVQGGSFGDITIVFKKNVYDPKLDSNLWERDAYTPTTVMPRYDVKRKFFDKGKDDIWSLVDSRYKVAVDKLYYQNSDMSSPSRFKEDALLGGSYAVALAYLNEKGIYPEIKVEKNEVSFDSLSDGAKKIIRENYDTFGMVEKYGKDNKYLKEIADSSPIKKVVDKELLKDWTMQKFLDNSFPAFKKAERVTYDTRALRDDVRKEMKGREDDFSSWVDDKMEGAWSDPYINIGGKKEGYNARNVVRKMKAGKSFGASSSFVKMTLAQARAGASKKILSLEKAKLVELNDDGLSVLKKREEEIADRINSIPFEASYKWPDAGPFEKGEEFFMGVASYYKQKRRDVDALKSFMSSRNFSLTNKELSELNKLLVEYENIPGAYLEAKPKDVVYVDSINTVIADATYVDEISALLPGVKVVERGTTTIDEMVSMGELEVFQTEDIADGIADLSDVTDKGRVRGDIMATFESLPDVEKVAYKKMADLVVKSYKENMNSIKSDKDMSLMLDVVDYVYRYNAHLNINYGMGVITPVMNLANEIADRAIIWGEGKLVEDEAVHDQWSSPTFMDQKAREFLKLLPKLRTIMRNTSTDSMWRGSLSDVALGDMSSLYAGITDALNNGYTSLSDTHERTAKEFVTWYESMGEEASKVSLDQDGILEKVQDYMSVALNGEKVTLSALNVKRKNIENRINESVKRKEKSAVIQAKLTKARLVHAERKEAIRVNARSKRIKSKIYQQMKREKPTITMTEREYYQDQARVAREVGKVERAELRERIKLAQRRKAMRDGILDLSKKIKARIKKGTYFNVEYGKMMLEFMDEFQKSGVSKKTMKKYFALLKYRNEQEGAMALNGEEESVSSYEERRQAESAWLKKTKKRFTQTAINDLSTEDMAALYDQFTSLIEAGRIQMKTLQAYTEEERQKKIETVTNGTINLEKEWKTDRLKGKFIATNDAQKQNSLRKQGLNMYLNMTPLYMGADRIDGDAKFKGQNHKMANRIKRADFARDAEKQTIASRIMALYTEYGINRLSQAEDAYLTIMARRYEDDGTGETAWIADSIVDDYFDGVLPEQVGNLTKEKAESLVRDVVAVMDEFAVGNRVASTYESITNKIFPKRDRYVARSQFLDIPGVQEDTLEMNAESGQMFNTNSKNVFDSFALSRKATNPLLKPATDFTRMLLDSLDDQLYYVHMQPIINDVYTVTQSRAYEGKAGKKVAKWWKEHLMKTAQRGRLGTPNVIEAVELLRMNATKAILSFKPSTILMQVTQYSTAILGAYSKYGMKAAMYVASELGKFVFHPLSYVDRALENSLVLQYRKGTGGYSDMKEVNEYMNAREKQGMLKIADVVNKFNEMGMTPMQFLDTAFAGMASEGITNYLESQGVGKQEAKIDADTFVDITQASVSLVDRPLLLAKGGSMTRLALALQSFTIGLWYMMYQEMFRNGILKGSTGEKARASLALAGVGMSQAMMASMITGLLGSLFGKAPDDEEENIVLEGMKEIAYSFPIAGSIVKGFVEYGGSDNIAASTIKGMITGAQQLTDGKMMQGGIKVGENVGKLLGIGGSATVADIVEAFNRSDSQKITNGVYSKASKLSLSSSSKEFDDAVSALMVEVYGDATDRKIADSIRGKLAKRVAKSSSNVLVSEVAKSKTNAEKAQLLKELEGQISREEYLDIQKNLLRLKVISTNVIKDKALLQ